MDKNKNRTDLLAAGRKKVECLDTHQKLNTFETNILSGQKKTFIANIAKYNEYCQFHLWTKNKQELQQFRKKKDQKGSSSSHGKSSGNASSPENEGNPEEPSKLPECQPAINTDGPYIDQSDSSVTMESVDYPSVPSASKMEQEELPSISLNHQEASHSGSQECNSEMLESRRDDSDGSIYEMAPDSEKTIEDIAAASSSGSEAVQEMDGSSFASEVSGEGAGSSSVSNDAANERDKRQISLGEHNIRGGMNEETTVLAQEAAPQSSFLTEGLQEAGSNLPDKTEESISLEEKMELPSSSRDNLSSDGEGGAVVVAAEGEIKYTEGIPIHLISGYGRTAEESGSSTLAEEIKMAGTDISEKAVETNTLKESSTGLPLSRKFMAAEGEDGTLAADEEGERKNGEIAMLESGRTQGGDGLSRKFMAAEGEDGTLAADEEGERINGEIAMLESGRTQGGDGSSIPDKVLAGDYMDPFHRPESTAVEETLEIVSSTSQAIPLLEGGDGAVVIDEDGGRKNNKEYIQKPETSQEGYWSSGPGELHKANTSLLDEPGKPSHIEANLETVAYSKRDVQATEGEAGAVIAAEGEEGRATEGSVLQSIVEDAIVESLEKLPEQGVISFGEMAVGTNKEYSPLGSSNSEVDSIRQLLYITTIEKEAVQLLLDEQIALNEAYQRRSFDEASKLRDLLKETHDSKAMVTKELDQCRSSLQTIATAKEEFKARCLSIEGEMEKFRVRAGELQNRLEEYQEGLSHALVQLADCRVSIETLQMENSDLTENIFSEKDARRELMKEKEFFSSENMKLVSEIMDQKEQLIGVLDKQAELQGNLRDAGECLEQLAAENLYLAISLDVHKATIEELNGRHLELPFEAKESGSQRLPFLQKDDEHGDSVWFGALKQHLEEAINILDNLEKSVDDMHSHTLSLSRSGGRVAAPGISKIIQAFESKSHLAENVSDEMPLLIEGGRAEYSYTLTKEQTCILRDVLKKMDLELGAEIHLTEEQTRREYTNKFIMVPGTRNQQSSLLQERIDDLVKKSSVYKSKIVDLQNHIDEMQQNANEETARLLSRVEMLEKELNDRVSIFKQEEDSFRGVIISAVEKLNASTGLQADDRLHAGAYVMVSVDAAVLAVKSLHEKLEVAHINRNALQTSFEELNESFMDMRGRNELAFDLLKKMYNRLREVVYDSYLGDALMDVNTDESLHLLHGNFDLLIEQLQKLIDERLHLLSTNKELEDGMLNKNNEHEELNMRCDVLAKKLEDECHTKEGLESILLNKGKMFEELSIEVLSLARKLENHELSKDFDAVSMLVKSDNVESDFCKSTLLRLGALVDFHLQKHEEAIEQINSSKIYLQEVDIVTGISSHNWSLPLNTLLSQEFVPKVSELKEKIQLLSASNLQQETEIQILKKDLSRVEEALEASRSELNLKVSELEQSEQRLSSVREKLSIAVAKGKGLIVQRDSLKQSLMEKLSELEKCMQELQSKETLLHEIEAKLKSCSEVDRVEALESELSYIRDSATALRDSFLLKDSVLQRIEEVLEDLDLPEHFHSKDIVEKIELLSRMVAGNSSFAVTEWDQKSSEGRSHSDAGFVVMDSWKDDIQPNSNQEFDELKRKYEELQSKFYGLAEHNDMLEQSLLERNSLVQKWEEMLDRFDWPSHLRTLEPEDRIESLGRALSEIQQERDALQLKIENLEVSSDMLIVDLEESHKRISELNAEVVTVKSEKDFFSESLGKLRFQYLALSEKAEHDEVERENLQRKLADLEEKLVEKVEDEGHHDIENEMRKLQDLVLNALPDSHKFETVPEGSGIASLEPLVRKLIDNYTILSLDKPEHILGSGEAYSEKSTLSLGKQSSGDALHDKDQELFGMRLELDETSWSLVLVKEERDAAMEKCHSLTLEIEEITRHMNLLQEERTHGIEKYQTLVLELEAVGKHRDALQEQLTQEEQKSAAAREKLNVAVRKGKGLVQQRDALKQTIEEMNTMVGHLKVEHNQRVEALESEKYLLMNELAQSNQNLQEYSQNLSRLLTAVHSIDIGTEVNISDPVHRLEEIGRISHHLHSAVVSSEHEAKRSKQAAELLLVELNEVQDTVDILQEDLGKAEAALAESYRQKHEAEAAKVDALSRLEQFMSVHSEEIKKHIDNLLELKFGIDQLRKGCIGFSSLLSDVFRKDVGLFSYVQSFLESILKQMSGENVAELPVLGLGNLLHINPISEDNPHAVGDVWQLKIDSQFGDGLIAEHLAHVCCSLHECMREYDDLKEKVHQYVFSIHQQENYLSEILETVKRKFGFQKEYSESLKRELTGLELAITEKEIEICSMHKNVSLLYEACSCSIAEIENRKAQTIGSSFAPESHISEKSSRAMTLPGYLDAKEHAGGHIIPLTEHSVRVMADSLLSSIQSSTNISETVEGNQRQLKATILDLQRELQEKDIEMKRTSEDFVSQIRDAEAVAKRSLTDVDSARAQVFSLEKKLAEMENGKQLLELRVSKLKDCEASSQQLQDRVKSLTDLLATKDQEIEGLKCGLMQALDEEDLKMEAVENRNKELEDIVQEKMLELENLEASRAKALAKLSTTVTKFDELHNLSESLLAETESLESQLQERDSEISFLRQEVTRCTNKDLASQETNKKYLSEINEVLTWMEMMVSHFGEPEIHANDQNCSQIHVYVDILDKKLASVMNELEDLRVTAQSKDALLQIERGRVEELQRKTEDYETNDKKIQRELFQEERDSVQPSSSQSPGHVEIEQMVQRNKVSSAPAVTHIRSGRKVNNDQIAIAMDMDKDDNILDDEDDDKAHGFKSLTMSRLIPRVTRPVADRIDGIWVSAERLLMRQPSLRLGIIVYWVLLHALLASII